MVEAVRVDYFIKCSLTSFIPNLFNRVRTNVPGREFSLHASRREPRFIMQAEHKPADQKEAVRPA